MELKMITKSHYFERSVTPPANTLIVVFCPDWCSEAYQVCTYDETGFNYDAQLNSMFDKCVTHWSFLSEMEYGL